MEWLTAREAARRLGINYQSLPAVVKATGMRTRNIPGLSPKYHAGDVDEIAARAVRVGLPPADDAPTPKRREAAGAVR